MAKWLLLAALLGSVQPAAAHDQPAIARALGGLRWAMRPAAVQAVLGVELSVAGQEASVVRSQLAPGATVDIRTARDRISRSFYAFDARGLRMVYTLFEPLAFPEGSFEAFGAALQRRFGPGAVCADGPQRWLEWQDRATRVRALDFTRTRGLYVLILEPRAQRSPAARPLCQKPRSGLAMDSSLQRRATVASDTPNSRASSR